MRRYIHEPTNITHFRFLTYIYVYICACTRLPPPSRAPKQKAAREIFGAKYKYIKYSMNSEDPYLLLRLFLYYAAILLLRLPRLWHARGRKCGKVLRERKESSRAPSTESLILFLSEEKFSDRRSYWINFRRSSRRRFIFFFRRIVK